MIICHCHIHMELPYVSSLKGRRSILNSLKEKLRSFNVSILDISGEYAKEADLAFAFLSHDAKTTAQYKEKIEHMLEHNFGEYVYELDYEEI